MGFPFFQVIRMYKCIDAIYIFSLKVQNMLHPGVEKLDMVVFQVQDINGLGYAF
jgi:hypothetical protein